MRDESFTLEPGAADRPPPFSARFINRPWPLPTWTIRDGHGRPVGHAKTRAGGRRAVRALYAEVPL